MLGKLINEMTWNILIKEDAKVKLKFRFNKVQVMKKTLEKYALVL